jgi:hypothetical protein
MNFERASESIERMDLPQLSDRALPVLIRTAIPHAKLPALYAAAKTALAECSRVDEVKDIADKHLAIATYAREINDGMLLLHAKKVYARAFLAIGDKLAELNNQSLRSNGKKSSGKLSERNQIAQAAGIKQRHVSASVTAAKIPSAERDRLIDGDTPPTVSSLYYRGRKIEIEQEKAEIRKQNPNYDNECAQDEKEKEAFRLRECNTSAFTTTEYYNSVDVTAAADRFLETLFSDLKYLLDDPMHRRPDTGAPQASPVTVANCATEINLLKYANKAVEVRDWLNDFIKTARTRHTKASS